MPTYGKVKVDTITYDSSGTATDVSVSNIATKASPTFTGTVTVPTPDVGDNSTKAASTAFVVASFATKIAPTFTGTVTVPTPTAGDNSTKAASTAFVATSFAPKASPAFTGTATGVNLTLSGDLTVQGTTTTIDTTTLQVEDKNIEIGKVSSPSDTTADGGGLTLLGATNKTWNWVNSTDAWTSSEHIQVASGKTFIGDGSTLTALNASNIATGTVATARLGSGTASSSNFLRGDNSWQTIDLTNLSASNLTSGTIPDARFPSTLPAVSGANLTNLPAGGNTFTAVADGAIATNKCVKLKTNGKVEEIAQVITGGNPADDNSVENCSSTTTSNVSLVYDPDQDKIICYYTSSYANDNMKYSVMTINASGRAQGFSGSDTGIESSIKVNGAYEWGTACYDTQNNKHIWGARCRNDNNVYVGVGTYNTSNNTITWPSGKSNYSQPNGANNNARIPTLYFDDTTNRIVCLLRDDSNSDRPYVVIGTVSGSTISWGTKQVLDTTDIRDNNTIICKAGTGTGKVFIGYRSSTNALKGNLITVSTSSNTCTVESSATIIAGAGSIRGAYNAEDNNILIAYEDVNDSSKGKLRRLTLSGTGFTVSSALTFCVNDQPSRWDVVYNTSGKQCYVFFRISSSNNRLNAFRVTNTSGTPTKSSDVQGRYDSTLTNSAQIGISMANRNTDTTNDKLYAGFIYSGDDKAYIETWACLSATSNQTSSTKHQYVGYADQAYSDGQTATIITYGNTKSGLSGLTTGTNYFVNGNGNLSTGDQGLGHAGLALAADKLLIKEPEI